MLSRLVKNHFSYYLRRGARGTSFCTFNEMDRYSKILATSRQIKTSLENLTAKLSELEKHYEGNLFSKVEKENETLISAIQKCKDELVQLENSRSQLSFSGSVPHEGTQPLQTSQPEPPKVENKVLSQQGKKQEKKPKIKAENKEKDKTDNKPGTDDLPVDVGRLDMRVGKIVEIKKHPDADSLYVEQVDIGKESPITVVSGLVKHVPIEEMQGRLVVILCNLKPAKMRGITSEGMVMCASTPEKVEVLSPPSSAVPGDLIQVEGFPRNPDAVLNPKKKIFETVAPDLKTNNDRVATYKGHNWVIPDKGPVVTQSLVNVNIK